MEAEHSQISSGDGAHPMRAPLLDALNWELTYEQSKKERVIVFRFGPYKEYEKKFVDADNARLFHEHLNSLGIPYQRYVCDFDSYVEWA